MSLDPLFLLVFIFMFPFGSILALFDNTQLFSKHASASGKPTKVPYSQHTPYSVLVSLFYIFQLLLVNRCPMLLKRWRFRLSILHASRLQCSHPSPDSDSISRVKETCQFSAIVGLEWPRIVYRYVSRVKTVSRIWRLTAQRHNSIWRSLSPIFHSSPRCGFHLNKVVFWSSSKKVWTSWRVWIDTCGACKEDQQRNSTSKFQSQTAFWTYLRHI